MSRAGFVGLAGRPNVGKSTLVNAIVGTKVAIVSDRPQTTRRAVRGIATDAGRDWQMVLVDLPGVQRPRDRLTQRMQRRVEHELADADVVLLLVNAEQGVGPGDRFIANAILGARSGDDAGAPVICAVNKIDRVGPGETTEVLAAVGRAGGGGRDVPDQRADRRGARPSSTARLAELLPDGPLLYPPEDRTDRPSELHLAELIREQVLKRTREEIPHAVEVVVTDVSEREDGLRDVQRPDLGRERVPEGNPDRQGRPA